MFVALRNVGAWAAIALVASGAVAGCNDKALQSSASTDAGKRLGTAITQEQAGKVLAKVGDRTITLGDFVAAIEHMDQFDRLRYQSPERRRELLAEMINVQLLADEAEAKGYDKDPHVQQEVRAILRDAMLAEAHKGAPSANEISEAEVRAYYDRNRASFRDPERRRVSVIVLRDADSASVALEAARRTTSAAQWGEVVRAKSIDPGAQANVPIDLVGDFGIVSAPGEAQAEPNAKVPSEVRAALFLVAKIGDVYDKVVRASDGRFFVLRMTQRTEPHDRSYAEAERSIRTRLVQEKIREQEEAFVARLKADYPVKIDDAVLATVRVDLAADGGSASPVVDASVAPPQLPTSQPASQGASSPQEHAVHDR
jgi:DNA-directed RNA polymerase subunit F